MSPDPETDTTPDDAGGRWRLQRWMAHCGLGSRRACEEWIREGRVRLNGEIVTRQGETLDPERDELRFDGRPVKPPGGGRAEPIVLALYKPRGVTTTLSDRHAIRTIASFVPRGERLYPVGRLDRDSEGLLFLTNDGDLAHRLAHPRYQMEKEYEALVVGQLAPDTLARWSDGIDARALDGEPAPNGTVRMKARARWAGRATLDDGRPARRLMILLTEGRKRQIRRMVQAVGGRVVELRRVRIGPIRLGNLAPGQSRRLGAAEIALLRKAVELG